MTAETFHTPIAFDLVAVGVGSLQGAMYAAGFKRIDLLGVAIIGIATGIGGGFLRDILLNVSPAAFANNWYLVTAVGAAFVGMLLPRLLRRVDPVITLFDALSLGMFAAIGATKALALGLPVVPALFIGVISGVGGGVVRDVILNIPIALMHVGSLYAFAALAGVGVLATLILVFNVPVFIAGIACVVVTTLLRLLAVRFGWSLPEQRALSRLQLRKQKQVEAVIEEALHTGVLTVPITLPDLDSFAKENQAGDESSPKHGRHGESRDDPKTV
ncbi:TRIC cation channel family protein [Leucobacter sp. UT-8R-CII-1-4]|uniref:trimeric intracellular cation channel family protein n=1 Tax=Leucobacter sp. UT-8R-CII-1-4 TaxID=3040075 RepID=UPI0024A97A2E|nr:TRIC cation channel family protein [Leucobacter sp. UT-8R-CII-1-4]MDI6022218.1 TRIC cation channel family protein [Leucobacter sp. UT-8R-CII-1-4]